MTRKPYKELTESQKQTLNGLYVDREVYFCCTHETEYILKQGFEDSEAPYNYDDFTNRINLNFEDAKDDEHFKDYWINNYLKVEDAEPYIFGEKKLTTDQEKAFIKWKRELTDDELKQIAQDHDIDLSDYEEESEIYEYWKVSDRMIHHLKQHDETTNEDFNIWGRCTTGQSIKIDSVIYGIVSTLWDEGYYFDGRTKTRLPKHHCKHKQHNGILERPQGKADRSRTNGDGLMNICLNCNKPIKGNRLDNEFGYGYYCSENCIRAMRIKDLKDIHKKIKTTEETIYQKTSGTNLTYLSTAQMGYIYNDLIKIYSQLQAMVDRFPPKR